jgi:hypothetical protein
MERPTCLADMCFSFVFFKNKMRLLLIRNSRIQDKALWPRVGGRTLQAARLTFFLA